MSIQSHLRKVTEYPHYLDSGDRNTISTTDAYFKLPLARREKKVWFWCKPWYLLPYAMSWNCEEDGLGEWDMWKKAIIKQYPVQYWLRNMGEIPPVWWCKIKWMRINENVIYPATCFFRPRNKEISRHIPRTYKSSDKIIEDVLYAIFIQEYGEGKEHWRGEDANAPEGTTKYWSDMADKYDEISKWITIERLKLQQELDKAWGSIPKGKLPYEEKYKDVHALEKLLLDGDSKALSWIVEHRKDFD